MLGVEGCAVHCDLGKHGRIIEVGVKGTPFVAFAEPLSEMSQQQRKLYRERWVLLSAVCILFRPGIIGDRQILHITHADTVVRITLPTTTLHT